MHRVERLKIRHQGQLQCECCGKWTLVDPDLYNEVHEENPPREHDYIYLCTRPRCLRTRPELFLSPKLISGTRANDRSDFTLYYPIAENLYFFGSQYESEFNQNGNGSAARVRKNKARENKRTQGYEKSNRSHS